MNAEKVGKYFYVKDNELSEIQIQKLTYYAYVWRMILKGEKLFDEKPQAWVHGPVFRSLYDAMKKKEFYDVNDFDIDLIEKSEGLLKIIYDLYGRFSGNELEKMTHSEFPWKNARIGKEPNERSMKEISDEDIKKYYKSLLET